MTGANKWRVAIAVLIVLVLVGRWVTQPTSQDASVIVVEPTDATGGPARVRLARTGNPDHALATVVLRVGVAPDACDLEWTATVYLEPTRSRGRALISQETRHGAGEITWRVPRDRLAIHVHTSEGVGHAWHEVDASDVHEHEIAASLQALALITGRVLTGDGSPVAGARVAFVPTEGVPAVHGRPPGIEGGYFRPSESPLSSETDAEGRYRIDRVDPRVPYHGAASRPGFGVRRELGVTVSPAGTTEQSFSLEVGCRVSGRLLDATGSPIAGATLTVATAQPVGELGTSWSAEGQAESGADGGFAFDCLGPGWKKVQTILVAAPGESIVGHWECRVDQGDARELGDLLVPDSLYEATIHSPEGGECAPRVRFGFVPDSGRDVDAAGALLTVPVAADDRGRVRVRGLPPGRTIVVVRDTAQQDEGWWRPPTRIEDHFDGGHVTREWELLPLREGDLDRRDASGNEVVTTNFSFPETGGDALAIAFVNDELVSMHRVSSAGLELETPVGDRVRLVLTDGDRWGEYSLVAESDSRQEADVRADRVGSTLEIQVRDEGRAVPGAMVFIGPAAHGADGVFPFRRTRRDGNIVLSGLPPELELCVTAHIVGNQPEPQAVEWVAGRATVVIDVSEN